MQRLRKLAVNYNDGIPRTPAVSVLFRVPSCPSWLMNFRRNTLAALSLVTLIALTSACRLDMHVQPRENPLSRSDFFADGRSARPLVEGTVARGQLREDTYFYTGTIGSSPGDYMPFPV